MSRLATPFRRVLARASSGVLRPHHLELPLDAEAHTYRLTFDRWGGVQTSRNGQNLVIQLGFPSGHDRAYKKLLGIVDKHPFVTDGHPARSEGPLTLAWARLDVDLRSGVVLVEEVQSDWVRAAAAMLESAEEWLSAGRIPEVWLDGGLNTTPASVVHYLDRVLRPCSVLWSEALLSAVLYYVYERLGARTVYFHTPESGCVMKRVSPTYAPPRSLYTDLPRRFCFRRSSEAPAFLASDRRVRTGNFDWHVLRF